jgi:ATP-dependent helicase/nuclease subunit A
VINILENEEFAPVFGPESVAEASIAGIAGKQQTVIAGRIDRIAVLKEDVYIIDYKTGRKVPENESQVPEAYLRQMEAYRQLVSDIYKYKTIHCALLWTSGPMLIALSNALLESLAA